MGQQHRWSGAERQLERSKDLPLPIALGPGYIEIALLLWACHVIGHCGCTCDRAKLTS